MGRRQCFVLQDSFNLRTLHTGKPCEKLLDRGPIAEIFKQRRQRHACTSKHPRATALLRVALYGITILPLLHILPSSFMPEDQRTHNAPTTDTCTISSLHCTVEVLYTLPSADSSDFFPRLWRLTYGRNRASPCVACYPRGQPVGRRDRPRIGAVCPFVRLVSGVGDHIIGDRPRPDPVWEAAGFSVTPAPPAILHLFPASGGRYDTPERLLPCSTLSTDPSAPSATRAFRRPPSLQPPCRRHRHRRSRALGGRAPGVRPATRAPFRHLHRRPRRPRRLAH